MMHAEGDYAMVHAGLLPQWSIDEARVSLGKEVEQALRGAELPRFLKHMYGDQPDRWDDALAGWDRLRVIVNAMTRMRFCDRQGRIDLQARAPSRAKGYLRWYETRPREARTLIFGHWSQLGLVLEPAVAGAGQRLRLGRRAQRIQARGPHALSGTLPRLSGPRRRSMSDCVFCRIVARQIPATVVHEDEHTLAFMDLGQVNPGMCWSR